MAVLNVVVRVNGNEVETSAIEVQTELDVDEVSLSLAGRGQAAAVKVPYEVGSVYVDVTTRILGDNRLDALEFERENRLRLVAETPSEKVEEEVVEPEEEEDEDEVEGDESPVEV